MIFFISVIGCVLIFTIFYLIRRATRSKKRKKLRNYFSDIISEIAVFESPEKQADIQDKHSIAEPVSSHIETEAMPQKISVTSGNKNGKAIAFNPLNTVNHFPFRLITTTEEASTDYKLGTELKSFTGWLKSMKKHHSEKMAESDEQTDKTIQDILERSNADTDVSTEAMAEVLSLQLFLEDTTLKLSLYKLLQSSFARNVFINELTKASFNMAGVARENLKWVYEYFRLEKDSEKRMKSNKWHIKAKAIQELAQMQQKKYVKNFYKLANHSNTFVRQEAQTAIVKLFGFSGLRFLDVISYTITDWQQLCLLQELTSKRITSFEGLERWIRSSNSSVVIFALRLVETYHWHELHDEVAAQLTHPSHKVQQKAIQTLGEVYNSNTAKLLIAAYTKINKQLQFAVLKVFEKAATENEIPFLLQQLKHPDNQFKLIAARAIHNCGADNTAIIRDNIINNGYSAAALLSKLLEEEIV